jgi:hypothetical protein
MVIGVKHVFRQVKLGDLFHGLSLLGGPCRPWLFDSTSTSSP